MKNNKLSSIKIFADGANIEEIKKLDATGIISGYTTNPTLMKAAGITNYELFCREMLEVVSEKPVSFEVFSDEMNEMHAQALKINSWGKNVFVKIPITNTKGESTNKLVKELVENGVKVNVTAVFTMKQVEELIPNLVNEIPSNISIFAGRIADTGVDPCPHFRHALDSIRQLPNCELIWASPRELLNLYQAVDVNCHIITVTSNLLSKLNLLGYSLEDYSLDTVKMFRNDAISSGYELN
jgi:transaldolase